MSVKGLHPACYERDWTQASLTDLVDHVVSVHHTFVRREMAILRHLLQEMIEQHGRHHPQLMDMQSVFDDLEGELMMHLLKEEQTLFPAIVLHESARAAEPVENADWRPLVESLENEHTHGDQTLAKLRALAQRTGLDTECSAIWRSFCQGLDRMEADLQQHVHEENDILFPSMTLQVIFGETRAEPCGAGVWRGFHGVEKV
ncbi:MAG: hemerythrin domain-containing protein [Tepidisphaeraceae bacterium]